MASCRPRSAARDTSPAPPTTRSPAPAVGAAGLVLASSFGTLMLESGQASREQGFAMAFGILLASLVVSSILVPALTALVGRRAWQAPTHIDGTAPEPAG